MTAEKAQLGKRRGRLLQRLREDAGYEQKDIAAALDVSRVTVSRWETGDREPSRSVIRELVMMYISRGAELEVLEAAEAGIEIPRKTKDRPVGEGAYATPNVIPLEELERDQGLFYDGVLHAIAAFNRTQGELIAEVQQWRAKHRETLLPLGSPLASQASSVDAAKPSAGVVESDRARMPDWVTEEELAEDDRVMDAIEAAAAKEKRPAANRGKRASA